MQPSDSPSDAKSMIPLEQADKSMRGMHRLIYWTVILSLLGLVAMTWWVERFTGIVAWVPLMCGALYILWFARATKRLRILCPACAHAIESFARMKRTGRCPCCRRVVMAADTMLDVARERKKWRNANIRIAFYLFLSAIATPFGMQWLKMHQLLPPNKDIWEGVFMIWTLLLILYLPFLFLVWAVRLKKRRESEDVPILSPYPVIMLTIPGTWGAKVYRMYLSPHSLCFARVAAHFFGENDPITHSEAGFLFLPVIERSLQQKRRLEALYDTLDPASPELLAVNPAIILKLPEMTSYRWNPIWRAFTKSRRERSPFGRSRPGF